jgi:hypothetical protein
MSTQTLSALKTFHFAFQISRKIIFNVSYYYCGSNASPYFSTSADQFNGPKTDFNRSGQAQNDLLKGHPLAMNFYKKFDQFHTKDLTAAQHAEVLAGLEKLKAAYNWIESANDIPFSSSRALSMMKVK